MTALRAAWVAVRLLWPHVLTPWRSPLIRWRIETYGITAAGDSPDGRRDGRLLHADELTAADFFRFTRLRRRALARFLRWAAWL